MERADRVGEVRHLDDVNKFVELLDDLFEDALISLRHDRHLRDGGVERGADRDGLDVEPPAGKQTRDTRQHAEFVFNKHRYDMFHDFALYGTEATMLP